MLIAAWLIGANWWVIVERGGRIRLNLQYRGMWRSPPALDQKGTITIMEWHGIVVFTLTSTSAVTCDWNEWKLGYGRWWVWEEKWSVCFVLLSRSDPPIWKMAARQNWKSKIQKIASASFGLVGKSRSKNWSISLFNGVNGNSKRHHSTIIHYSFSSHCELWSRWASSVDGIRHSLQRHQLTSFVNNDNCCIVIEEPPFVGKENPTTKSFSESIVQPPVKAKHPSF